MTASFTWRGVEFRWDNNVMVRRFVGKIIGDGCLRLVVNVIAEGQEDKWIAWVDGLPQQKGLRDEAIEAVLRVALHDARGTVRALQQLQVE